MMKIIFYLAYFYKRLWISEVGLERFKLEEICFNLCDVLMFSLHERHSLYYHGLFNSNSRFETIFGIDQSAVRHKIWVENGPRGVLRAVGTEYETYR